MLTEAHLTALLDASETRLVERKSSMPNAGEVRRTLVAFANSVLENEHAVLFIGIADDGQRIGVSKADDIQRSVRKIAEHDCFPPIHCEPQVIRPSGVEIVAVVVPVSKNRPHFSGHAYVRRGSENVNASPQMFEEMIASRNDKARRILAHKGKVISARFTGDRNAVEGPEFKAFVRRELRDFVVEECDGHYVRFRDLSTGRIYTPSLEHVAIEGDPLTHRFRLFVNENS